MSCLNRFVLLFKKQNNATISYVVQEEDVAFVKAAKEHFIASEAPATFGPLETLSSFGLSCQLPGNCKPWIFAEPLLSSIVLHFRRA